MSEVPIPEQRTKYLNTTITIQFDLSRGQFFAEAFLLFYFYSYREEEEEFNHLISSCLSCICLVKTLKRNRNTTE
jgi:hypothetical protein